MKYCVLVGFVLLSFSRYDAFRVRKTASPDILGHLASEDSKRGNHLSHDGKSKRGAQLYTSIAPPNVETMSANEEKNPFIINKNRKERFIHPQVPELCPCIFNVTDNLRVLSY